MNDERDEADGAFSTAPGSPLFRSCKLLQGRHMNIWLGKAGKRMGIMTTIIFEKNKKPGQAV
jgi:hypothetical protein